MGSCCFAIHFLANAMLGVEGERVHTDYEKQSSNTICKKCINGHDSKGSITKVCVCVYMRTSSKRSLRGIFLSQLTWT